MSQSPDVSAYSLSWAWHGLRAFLAIESIADGYIYIINGFIDSRPTRQGRNSSVLKSHWGRSRSYCLSSNKIAKLRRCVSRVHVEKYTLDIKI